MARRPGLFWSIFWCELYVGSAYYIGLVMNYDLYDIIFCCIMYFVFSHPEDSDALLKIVTKEGYSVVKKTKKSL
jgi:hypothetical protein